MFADDAEGEAGEPSPLQFLLSKFIPQRVGHFDAHQGENRLLKQFYIGKYVLCQAIASLI